MKYASQKQNPHMYKGEGGLILRGWEEKLKLQQNLSHTHYGMLERVSCAERQFHAQFKASS